MLKKETISKSVVGVARYYSCLSSPLQTNMSQGIENRLSSTFLSEHPKEETGLVITDPFTLYLTYVSLGKLTRDESQLRAMKEFQKLYHRLLGYKPANDIAVKKSLLLRKLEILKAAEIKQINNVKSEPLHRLKLWFGKNVDAQKREIVRFMTDEEELHNIASPHGLLINGEVGCGKSMLMDIFASSLPHDSKMRWHYNSFILWVYGEIHQIQKERMLTASTNPHLKLTMENEFILFEIAQKMINKSTVLMLDEFMLPDVASAQIVKILFTFYFKLGGVLIGISNKLPEDLYSSAFNKSRFKSFVGILHNRCVLLDMASNLDYRRHFAQISMTEKNMVVKANNPNHEMEWKVLVGTKALALGAEQAASSNFDIHNFEWVPAEITVYNRTSVLPETMNDNICRLDFDFICKGLFSSSDYITLASTYKVFIIDNVPIMSTRMRNEARRFITLLDALYEARCQLFLRAADVPEKVFFPLDSTDLADKETVQQEEMYAKTAMQTFNPYRPNVSSYDQSYAKKYNDNEASVGRNSNFGDVKAFIGEDEKFAYKRAVSRIYEMVASDHWRACDRWLPIDSSMRPWEVQTKFVGPQRSKSSSRENFLLEIPDMKIIKEDLKTVLPRDLSSHMGISFRQFNRVISPAFVNILHFWGLGEWTLDQRNRVKDKLARSWVTGGIRGK